jgi:hypothetical protein
VYLVTYTYAACVVTRTHFPAHPQVQRVQYPELVPLCSLDALCLATLSAASMAHFDGGGLLDTSLDLGPLRELLGHGLVRRGAPLLLLLLLRRRRRRRRPRRRRKSLHL